MAIEDTEALDAAVTTLIRALRQETSVTRDGMTTRTAPARTVQAQAVLPGELHEVATAAQRFLHKAPQMPHPLYKWTITYQTDGAYFLAVAPN